MVWYSMEDVVKGSQSVWAWIVVLLSVLCLGALLAVASVLLWVAFAGREPTAGQASQATISALETENVRLAEQATLQPTPAPLTTLGATPTLRAEPQGEASSPQATVAPTDTPQPTPTLTVTPRPSLKPTTRPTEKPQILSFTAKPDPMERGGVVTLSWNAPRMVSASITRLSHEGDIFLEPEALDLPASGSITLQVPEDYTERAKYYLGARDASGVLYQAYVTVSIICRYDEYLAPRCPLAQDTIWAAYEPFAHGHMVWRSDTREIYVLYADGSYETYEDTWQEGEPVDIPGAPPSGRYAPVRGFGTLYAHEPLVRQGLGWATAEETGYTMHVETTHGGSGRYPGTSVYFTLPDNQVVNLYPFTSSWEIIP